MRRGTNVGKAYVSVTADGDGINEEIVDAVDDAGPGVKKAGKQHGEDYGDEFGDSLRVKFSHVADAAGEELNRRLADAAPEGADDYGDNFERRMKKSSKRIGNAIGNSLGSEINKALKKRLGDLEASLMRQMDHLVNQVSGNGGGGRGSGGGAGSGSQSSGSPQTLYQNYDFYSKFESARVKLRKAANDAIAKDDSNLVKTQQRLMDKLTKENTAAEKQRAAFVEKFMKARVKLIERSNDAILADDKQLVKDQQKLFDALKRQDAEMWNVRNTTAKAHYKYLEDLEKGRIDREGNAIKRASSGPSISFGDRVGGLLGKGSRNNALNLIGSTLGNVVGLVDKVRSGASSMFSTFAKGWAEAGEGATIFQKAMGGGSAVGSQIGKGLLNVAKAGPAAAAAIVLVVAAMSAMVSVASALLALVVALTSTIASALTGAVLVLGGAFIAAAAAGGLLVAAFLSMTDAQKKMLSQAFKPLKAELVGLGQLMITDMIPHFQTWSDHLREAIGLAGPLASVMGDAFGRAGDRLTASLSGPGFQNLFKALKQDLPEITKRMSGALGGFLNGLTGIFAAIMPLVLRFSGYLNRVAADFSEWANSAEGQNSIKDFADRAIESLKSLWKFVKEVSGFITDLLFSPDSQKAGNTMFDSLAKSFEGFRKKLQKAIEDGSLKKWFDDAIKFGGDMKDVIISIKDAFVKLDNSGVLGAVGDGLVVLADFIKDCNEVLGPLVDYLGAALPHAVDVAQVALSSMSFGGLLGHLDDAIGKVGSLINAIQSIPGVPGSGSGGGGEGFQGGGGGGGGSGKVLVGGPRPRTTTNGGGGGTKGGGKDWAQTMIDLGNAALNGTKGGGSGGSDSDGSGSGGKGGKGDHKKWKNPFVQWALSLIKEGPSLARQLGSAMKRMVTQINLSLNNAAKALDAEQARSILTAQMGALREAGRTGVQAARDALNSAAQSLADATTRKEAERALKAVRRAQRDLATAFDNQKKLNRAGATLEDQREIDPERVNRLVNGLTAQNATLADFARARSILAEKIAKANADLEAATQLRDSYIASVASGVKAYGNLTTAQASVIDGIEQQLSATDITTNLETRLAKIRKFQENLRILLASGLSQSAYQQIVDAGVEGGSAYADALVAGGLGAVGSVNGLVNQIDTIAGQLGLETGNRLYQAGVDAAQGLVDGLESMSEELDSAATALGLAIARAIKKALGLGGGGGGGGSSENKVLTASTASRVAVSPEAAQAAQSAAAVSGNDGKQFIWNGNIVTPTEDPHAVATEVVNEITGRLL